jgi:hypothetical protein
VSEWRRRGFRPAADGGSRSERPVGGSPGAWDVAGALAATPPARRHGGLGGAGLSGDSAERPREIRPRGGVGMGSREMQDEAADRAHDLHADRDEGLPEPGGLGAAERGPVRAELQLLKQDERRGRQRDAQLIGPEARAAGASEGEREFEFFEPILTIAAGAIDVGVDPVVRHNPVHSESLTFSPLPARVHAHHHTAHLPLTRPARKSGAVETWTELARMELTLHRSETDL